MKVDFGAATQVFHVGRASAAVPLALLGLIEAHRRYGSRPLEAVLEPGIDLGRGGYRLGPGVAFAFWVLAPIALRSVECRALFADGADIACADAHLFNRELASTLEAVARRPASVAELYATLAAEFGPERGGLITERDVADARVVDLTPIRVEHGGWELITMPGPSTGGVLVALGLRLLEGVGAYPYLSKEHVLRIARVQELLLAERDSPTLTRAVAIRMWFARCSTKIEFMSSVDVCPPPQPHSPTTCSDPRPTSV